ncbi:hypothetical protein [Leifsonia sp. Root227]|uniref:hypothetical protein n=1 Tax=Leifsonia sp. Root227 TaxID=1736496 RepID=UPI000B1FEEAD|nr:hypothetical protein [Leifsonia sp. Root227]
MDDELDRADTLIAQARKTINSMQTHWPHNLEVTLDQLAEALAILASRLRQDD